MINDMNDQENVIPSPRRTKRPPPVTPKRFNKFFTPRSSIYRVSKPGTSRAGRQLREITQSAVNTSSTHVLRSRSPKKKVIFKDFEDVSHGSATPATSSKKRKSYMSPESLAFDSSPCKRACSDSLNNDVISSSPPASLQNYSESTFYRSISPELQSPPPQLQRLGTGNVSGRILQRGFGALSRTERGRRRDNCIYWQAQTADFYTSTHEYHQFGALPYCTTSCNTNSLVATGDESGTIRLIDTTSRPKDVFTSTFLTFQPHKNAIMDLAFSSDDSMLATASGDQTSRVIDMQTQRVKYVMHAHAASVKQVHFQPGNDNVLATSSRDGRIYIWDLRCRGSETLVAETIRPTSFTTSNTLDTQYRAFNATPYNSISAAHTNRLGLMEDVPSAFRDFGAKDSSVPAPSRNGVSVTSLSFLSSSGRAHLLVSGCEASTTLRLWDIRNRYSRRGPPTPLSTTLEPESHSRHRNFGVTSLVQNSTGSRIYALSRDNTVYAFSSAHLINGHAPELENHFAAKHQRSVNDGRTGLGPIYGFRHPKLRATTFYVKASLRAAEDDKTEMLAVGSADHCALLFPTDESSFPSFPSASELSTPLLSGSSSSRPSLQRQSSGISTRMRDTIPIHNIGTPLVGGHVRDTTDLTWTHEGALVTLGDDHAARLWREGKQARRIRTAPRGQAAGCGWAEVEDGWDDKWEDDCEDSL